MNSQSKTVKPTSAVLSREERIANMLRLHEEFSPGLKGIEPPVDSFADPEDDTPAAPGSDGPKSP